MIWYNISILKQSKGANNMATKKISEACGDEGRSEACGEEARAQDEGGGEARGGQEVRC